MPTNHRQFHIDLESVLRNRTLQRDFAVRIRQVALTFHSALVRGTPVKTGRARGGHQISVGSPDFVPVNRLDPEGAQTIAEEILKLNTYFGFQSLYFANLVEYFPLLDLGSSAQAPSGVTALAVQATRVKFPEIPISS